MEYKCETLKGSVEIELPYGADQNELDNGLRQRLQIYIDDAMCEINCKLGVNINVRLNNILYKR